MFSADNGRTVLFLLSIVVTSVKASHCYNYDDCNACVGNTQGSACSYCGSSCQMATDICNEELNLSQGATNCPVIPYTAPPGVDFFTAISSATFQTNPAQRNYGVAITDVDGDDKFEALVAGYGVNNQLFKYDPSTSKLVDVALSFGIQDEARKAIGVAACDTDGDGVEEIYVLNTDQYSGVTATSDRLYRKEDSGMFSDLFELEKNKNEANYVAGRSCACVDSKGDGKYAVMVANYGGPMRLFTQTDGTVTDKATEAGVDRTTGGRALVSGPILTNRAYLSCFFPPRLFIFYRYCSSSRSSFYLWCGIVFGYFNLSYLFISISHSFFRMHNSLSHSLSLNIFYNSTQQSCFFHSQVLISLQITKAHQTAVVIFSLIVLITCLKTSAIRRRDRTKKSARVQV